MSVLTEQRIAQEIERRWREATAELKAVELNKAQALVSEAEKVLASAHEEGYRRGLQEAQEFLQAEMALVRKAYTQLESDRLSFIQASKRDITALSLRMAEALLRSELNTNPDALHALFLLAYDELMVQRKVFLFVHPDKLKQVEDLKHRLPLPADAPVLVRADSTLDKNSFRLEDELGGVRYDLPAALRQLEVEMCDDGV